MPGGVDEIQLIGIAVARGVLQGNALGLDGDSTLALDVHGIEHLGLHLAPAQPPADLDEPVRERRFAMIDMRDDGKIADSVQGDHQRSTTCQFRIGGSGQPSTLRETDAIGPRQKRAILPYRHAPHDWRHRRGAAPGAIIPRCGSPRSPPARGAANAPAHGYWRAVRPRWPPDPPHPRPLRCRSG